MPPRLSHRKTKTGCQRCKARKVKCDEGRPSCAACTRHAVPCEYTQSTVASIVQQALPTPPQDSVTSPAAKSNADDASTATLELRLMHEWTVYACKSFTTAHEYWEHQVVAVAFDFRYVVDSILALGALHASRRPPSLWIPAAGCMMPISELTDSRNDPATLMPNSWGLDDDTLASYRNAVMERATSSPRAATPDSRSMLNASHVYFDRAVEGHRNALTELTAENIEATYVASILISFLQLCNLGDASHDYALWLQLGAATRTVVQQWRSMIGMGWIAFAGVYYGKPAMTNEAELFSPANAEPFKQLLTHGRDYENMTEDDAKVYQESLSYIGLMYKGIVEGIDPPQVTCQRLAAMPSRLPPRLTQLVASRQPRALAMLAHTFACMKLLDGKSVWFTGIAEAQIPKIQRELPPA